jgi:hypothetical protein
VNPDTDTDLDPIRIQGFETEEKNTAAILLNHFLIKNCTFKGEAFSPPSTLKKEFMNLFLCLVVHFCPPGYGPIESGCNPEPACYCQHMICLEGFILPTYDMPEKACYCQHLIC